MDFHVFDLLDDLRARTFESFSHSLDVEGFVPRSFLDEDDKTIQQFYKAKKKKLKKEEKRYQRALRKQRRKDRQALRKEQHKAKSRARKSLRKSRNTALSGADERCSSAPSSIEANEHGQ